MIVRPAGIDAGRFLAYRSTDQVFGLSHPRSGSFAHEWRVTLQTRLLSLPFATARAGGCPEATTTRRRPYAQASHPEEGGTCVHTRTSGQVHMNEHWPKRDYTGSLRRSLWVWCKNVGVGRKARPCVGTEQTALCTKTTLLARPHVKRRLIPINWKPDLWSLILVSFERVWNLRTEDRQARHRVG